MLTRQLLGRRRLAAKMEAAVPSSILATTTVPGRTLLLGVNP